MVFSSVFVRFYCLSIPQALALAGSAALLLRWLDRRLADRPLWRCCKWLFLLAAVLLPVYVTVLDRTPGLPQAPVLQPFASYLQVLRGENPERIRSNLMNLLLFFPAGLTAGLLLRRCRRPVPAAAVITLGLLALSITLEWLQYRFCLGLPETDDVIHNTLGALLGAAAALVCRRASSQ